MNAAGDLVRQSADYVMTDANPNLDKYYSWGALAAASNGLMAMVTSVTDNSNCSVSAKYVKLLVFPEV